MAVVEEISSLTKKKAFKKYSKVLEISKLELHGLSLLASNGATRTFPLYIRDLSKDLNKAAAGPESRFMMILLSTIITNFIFPLR